MGAREIGGPGTSTPGGRRVETAPGPSRVGILGKLLPRCRVLISTVPSRQVGLVGSWAPPSGTYRVRFGDGHFPSCHLNLSQPDPRALAARLQAQGCRPRLQRKKPRGPSSPIPVPRNRALQRRALTLYDTHRDLFQYARALPTRPSPCCPTGDDTQCIMTSSPAVPCSGDDGCPAVMTWQARNTDLDSDWPIRPQHCASDPRRVTSTLAQIPCGVATGQRQAEAGSCALWALGRGILLGDTLIFPAPANTK